MLAAYKNATITLRRITHDEWGSPVSSDESVRVYLAQSMRKVRSYSGEEVVATGSIRTDLTTPPGPNDKIVLSDGTVHAVIAVKQHTAFSRSIHEVFFA